MQQAFRTLRVVQWVMLGSILLYAAGGEILGSGSRAVDPSLSYAFSTVSVAIVGAIFVIRRTLVFRSAQSLKSQPDDPVSLRHWKTGYLLTYGLCETLALMGLIQRIMGFNLQQGLPYYIGGFALLLFFGPKNPADDSPG